VICISTWPRKSSLLYRLDCFVNGMLCPVGRLHNRLLLHGPTQFQCRSSSVVRACFPKRSCSQSLIRLAVRFTFCNEDSGCKSQSTWRNESVSPNVRRVFRPQCAVLVMEQTSEHVFAEVDVSRVATSRLCSLTPFFCTHLDGCLLYESMSLCCCTTLSDRVHKEEGTVHACAVVTISNAFLFRPVDSDISCSSEVI
jgi:hypothetical protein